jgi:hypothetical protein
VTFDAGQNSQPNFTRLAELGLHFVGFPGSGVMTCTICTHREDRAAHADSDNAAAAAAVAGAGRQRMW